MSEDTLTPEQEDKKKFFEKLDKQHLLFETYVYAVSGRFGVTTSEAAKMIADHMKGEY